jgi:hypothetical protein
VLRFLLLAFACLTLVMAAAAMANEGKSLKDDYTTLLKADFWGKDDRVDRADLVFKGKDFPKLEITFTKLVPGGKGLVPAESFKVNGTLEEKGGKRVLVINGKAVSYRFERDASFLVLEGEFEHNKKAIKLTGKWGQGAIKK